MKKIILLIIMTSFIITGCSKVDKDVAKEFEKGKEALENGNYKDAVINLEEVVNKDGENDNARAMYIQAKNLMKALEYKEEENYKKAIKLLEETENIKGGLSEAKKQASKLKKEYIKLLEEYEVNFNKLKENAKDSIEKDKSRLEAEAKRAEAELRAQEEANKKADEEKKKQEEEQKKEEENKSDTNTEFPLNNDNTVVSPPVVPPASNVKPEIQTPNINLE